MLSGPKRIGSPLINNIITTLCECNSETVYGFSVVHEYCVDVVVLAVYITLVVVASACEVQRLLDR